MADNLELISSRAGELVSVAGLEGVTVGFAESLTGGLISSSVVAIPGASAVFKGSIVSYTNEVKENVLGVSPDIISAHTEVSAECAKAMAEGAKSVLGVDLAVSVTGIAGPTGELPGKPVGTVYMGYCFRDISGALRLNFEGDRDTIRTCTVLEALNQAISLIKEGKA
jgi:competence/damage-inducible protein CinA C-terminal domain